MYMCKYAHTYNAHIHRYMCMYRETRTQLQFYKCERFSLAAATLFNQSNLWSRRKAKSKYVYRQNTNKSSRKRNERDGDGEKTEKPNLPMYNQFNYFYEIVFSVWFIFGFAFCLLPYMPYTLFLTGTTHTHHLNKIV